MQEARAGVHSCGEGGSSVILSTPRGLGIRIYFTTENYIPPGLLGGCSPHGIIGFPSGGVKEAQGLGAGSQPQACLYHALSPASTVGTAALPSSCKRRSMASGLLAVKPHYVDK